jgi:hypothetical protein
MSLQLRYAGFAKHASSYPERLFEWKFLGLVASGPRTKSGQEFLPQFN